MQAIQDGIFSDDAGDPDLITLIRRFKNLSMLDFSSPSFIIPTILQVVSRLDNGRDVFDVVVGRDLFSDDELSRVGALLEDEGTLAQQEAFEDQTDIDDVLHEAQSNGSFGEWEKELAGRWREFLPSLRRMRLYYGYGEPFAPFGGRDGMGTASLLRLQPNDKWDVTNQVKDVSFPYWRSRPTEVWDQ